MRIIYLFRSLVQKCDPIVENPYFYRSGHKYTIIVDELKTLNV